jgi:hypothetical protein
MRSGGKLSLYISEAVAADLQVLAERYAPECAPKASSDAAGQALSGGRGAERSRNPLGNAWPRPGTDFRVVRDAIWASSLPPLARLVALGLVEYLPNVEPSIRALAERTGLCERAVRAALGKLEQAGCLVVRRRKGHRSSYTFAAIEPRQEAPRRETPRYETPRCEAPVAPAPDADPPRHETPPKQTREADKEADKIDSSSSPGGPRDYSAAHQVPGDAVPDAALGQPMSGKFGSLPDIRRVFEHYQRRLGHPKARLDSKRVRLIKLRLGDFSVEELCCAIDGCAKSDWHMGRDPKSGGQRFDGVELILRDAAHVERFMGLAAAEPPPRRFGSAQPDAGLDGWEGAKFMEAGE